MPKNTGTAPDHSGPIDIRLRNGRVIRNTLASKWRWKLNDPDYPPEWEFDVVEWQPSK